MSTTTNEIRSQTPRPALLLVGYGVGESLQITLEAQLALLRANRVYAIAPPAALVRHLGTQRVSVTDLAPRLREEGVEAVDAYLDVAGFVLREAALDPPVALLVPGNPLFQNSITRFLVQAARERDLPVAVFPGVSILDVLISDLGLDVTSRGLQVFDARHIVARAPVLNPAVPLFILQPGALVEGTSPERGETPSAVERLEQRLASVYPREHPVSLILRTTGRGEFTHRTRPLAAFSTLTTAFGDAAAIFCDLVRER